MDRTCVFLLWAGSVDNEVRWPRRTLTCARLFGLVQDPSLARGRKYLHELLQYRTDLEQHTRALPAIDALCNDYRRLSKVTLFGLTSLHGLLVSNMATKQNLKQHLMLHSITDGSCIQCMKDVISS